ncbi:MAG: hypothetical protein J7K33_10095 [Candidatus Marinimicrobia bacterium]|nr:hypothetical protein [Candidatus Neomarinimicrobiota bacterium]
MRAVAGHFSLKLGEGATKEINLRTKRPKGVKFLDFLIGGVTFNILYKNSLMKMEQGGRSHSTMKDWKYFVLNDVSGIKSVSRKSLHAVKRSSLGASHGVLDNTVGKSGLSKVEIGERVDFRVLRNVAVQEGSREKGLREQKISENGNPDMVTSVRTKRKKLNPEIVSHRDGKENGVSKVQDKMKKEIPGVGGNVKKDVRIGKTEGIVTGSTSMKRVKSGRGNVERVFSPVKDVEETSEKGKLKEMFLHGRDRGEKTAEVHGVLKAGGTTVSEGKQIGKAVPRQVGNGKSSGNFAWADIKLSEYKHGHVKGNMANARIEKVSSDLVQESVETVKGESETEVYPSNRENFSSLHSGEVKGIYRDNKIKEQVSSGVENRGIEHQKVTVETGNIRAESRNFSGIIKSESLRGFLVERILEIESYYRNDGKLSGARLRVDAGQYGDMVFVCHRKEEKEYIRIVVETEAIREQIRRVVSEVHSSLTQKGINIDNIEVETFDQRKSMDEGQSGTPRRSVSSSGQVESKNSGAETGLEEETGNFRDMGYNTIEILA